MMARTAMMAPSLLRSMRCGEAARPTVPCNQLLPLPNGQLWLGTEAGLFRFGADGVLRALPLPASGSSSTLIEALVMDPDGQRIWVAQRDNGVQAYNLAGQLVGPLIASESVREIWPVPDGTLWLVP